MNFKKNETVSTLPIKTNLSRFGNTSSQKWPVWFTPLLIFALTVIAYSPAIYGEFIWNDDTFLTNNPIMAKPDALKRFWASTEPPDYFPLVSTSLWIQRSLWGLNPMGYHLFNIVLHAFSAVFLWQILCKLNFQGAWIAAAIFAIHPVHVESVAWITEIKNAQSTFFFMLTTMCYLNFLSRHKSQWYILSLLFFIMALLSKTSVVMFPLIILLYHWWEDGFLSKKSFINSVPFFALSALFSGITIWFQYNSAGATGEQWSVEFIERVAIAGRAVWFYLGKLILPLNLMFVYPRWDMDPRLLSSYLPSGALIATGIILWNGRRDWGRPFLAGSGYFVITLFPILGFFNIYFMRYSFIADHWQYLASPGIIVLFVWIGRSCFERFSGFEYLKTTVIFLLLGLLTFATFHRAGIFQNNITIWEDTLKKNPNAWMAHTSLGVDLALQGKTDKAIERFNQALRIKPNFLEAHNSLGMTLLRQGKANEAIVHFKETLRINPSFVNTHSNLGLAFFSQGKVEKAIKSFKEALKVNSKDENAYYGLGFSMARLGKIDVAIKRYRQALKINPNLEDAHYHLGIALMRKGKVNEAIQSFKKTIRIRPTNARAYYDLGLGLAKLGRWSEATINYRQALKINPNSADTHYHLGIALLKQRREDEAIEQFKKTLKIKPSYVMANFNLGVASIKKRKADEAIRYFSLVLNQNPKHVEAMVNQGKMYEQKGENMKAKELWQKAKKINPDNFNVRMNLGNLYLNEGGYSEALAEFKTASEISPDKSVVYYYMARSLEGLEKEKAAIEYYKKLIKMSGFNKESKLVKDAEKRIHELK